MVTRFNNKTWDELQEYKTKNELNGSFYGVPRRICATIPLKCSLIVLEMNNETNSIMGVGLIKNYIKMDKTYKIYSWGNYHRFTYTGKHNIYRDSFTREEEVLIRKIEPCLFKGKGHLKRGQGIQKVPYDRYTSKEVGEIMEMFRCRSI